MLEVKANSCRSLHGTAILGTNLANAIPFGNGSLGSIGKSWNDRENGEEDSQQKSPRSIPPEASVRLPQIAIYPGSNR